MEDRSNKTIICSVLFLDIVEYSKKPVTGQIFLKERFNTYLSEAIHDVPVADRIILDTGDGAAVNFLGDVEAALIAALRFRESLLKEDVTIEPQLLVRIGINLGPVRLVRDINGQPNIVGDGINVAQRVMGFADASQILVSRSYYDAVSRLSHEYKGMFHNQGSRTDKHVREHEIYAIGYPGDQTTKRMSINGGMEKLPLLYGVMLNRVKAISLSVVAEQNALSKRIKQASMAQRILMVVIPLLLLVGVLALMFGQSGEMRLDTAIETMPTAAMPAVAAVAAAPTVDVGQNVLPSSAVSKVAKGKTSSQSVGQAKINKTVIKKQAVRVKSSVNNKHSKKAKSASNQSTISLLKPVPEAYISVSCKEGAQVFVDGVHKGRLDTKPLIVRVKPGRHKVIITHESFGIYTVNFDLASKQTKQINPKACN
ncbi:MAG: adenylate/guanylate cyclase domain-containing protein [Gallionella sp.]